MNEKGRAATRPFSVLLFLANDGSASTYRWRQQYPPIREQALCSKTEWKLLPKWIPPFVKSKRSIYIVSPADGHWWNDYNKFRMNWIFLFTSDSCKTGRVLYNIVVINGDNLQDQTKKDERYLVPFHRVIPCKSCGVLYNVVVISGDNLQNSDEKGRAATRPFSLLFYFWLSFVQPVRIRGDHNTNTYGSKQRAPKRGE